MDRRRYGDCLNCGNPVNRRAIYCSNSCQHDYQYKQYIERWLEGKEDGCGVLKLRVSMHVKRWLIETHGHRCSICGLTEWMRQPIPLIVDHIDGNGASSGPNNLRLVCGNCNMQLPTFAGANKGNGRKHRRERDRKDLGLKRHLSSDGRATHS